ncbi:MAG: hypothetical protein M3Q29_01625 [Chloroflexota bacterium]|nr:hypothetical protein [Chloroflexota bacterium]
MTRKKAVGGAWAGLTGSVAYALAMWLDLRLVRYRFNDFTLLGRPFSTRRRVWLLVGAALHLLNGSAVGVIFASVCQFFPGPGWLRGLLFAQL